MSLHIIEDLIEGSIRVLHAHSPEGDRRVRDSIAVLYAFQNEFDCSFTRFRVLDELIARRYTYRFAVEDHPDHAALREFLDGITEFTALAEDEPDPEDWPDPAAWLDEGYVDPPDLFCDAGTALWRRMVESGRLTGPDAEPLRRVPLSEVVLDVVTAARQADDIELIALWHALGGDHLLDEARTEDPERLRVVCAIREIAIGTGAVTYEILDGIRPPAEIFDGEGWAAWWSGADGQDLPVG